MLKKLLVAVIALSFMIAMCGSAYATKDPNAVKTIKHTLENSPKTISEAQSALPDQPPQYTKSVASGQHVPGLTKPAHRASTCTWYDYSCNVYYYWLQPDAYGDDFFNMRFTSAGTDICSLRTVEMLFYEPPTINVTGEGINVWVWEDAFGFPGLPVGTPVNVTYANMVGNFYPNYLYVDFEPQGITFTSEDFHVGWTTVNQGAGNVYAGLSDDGTCGTVRSSENYAGTWGTMLNDWGADVNFNIAVELCCYTPGGAGVCTDYSYDCNVAYFWTIPDAYGDELFNMRFTSAEDGCTLTTVCVAFYAPPTVPGSGVDIIVWDASVGGFPAGAMYSQHVDDVDIFFYPTYTCVDFTSLGLVFDQNENFHIGWNTTDQVNDVYAGLSDDGSCGTMRSSEYWGAWGSMYADWGADVNFLITARLCCPPPPAFDPCVNINYAGAPFFYWTIPDVYGDDFFNMRFTPPLPGCTLKVLNLSFYQAGSVGNPGALIYLWYSDGVFPSTVWNTFPVNPVSVWFPGFTSIDVSAFEYVPLGDFHVGYTPIYNGGSDVLAIISDDGSTGTQRSSENDSGVWGLMLTDWGIDVNFFINVDVCCAPPGSCLVICDPNDQWPTFGHDFARTSQSGIKLGDLCDLKAAWVYDPNVTTFINFAEPVISGDKVYVAYDNRMVCLNLLTGAEIWATNTIGAYAGLVTSLLRCQPTIEGDYIYFSTGSTRGMLKAGRHTGLPIAWARCSAPGTPLEGTTQTIGYGPSVIIGNEIYFGNQAGTIYALDKMTGVTLYTAVLRRVNPVTGTPTPTYASPASDGTNLFWGISATTGGGGGGIHSVTPTGAAFTANWYYESPFQSVLNEGYSAGPSYRCEQLFIHSLFAFVDGSNSNFAGIRMKLDPVTGAEMWPDHFYTGQGVVGPPATWNDRAIFSSFIGSSLGAAGGRSVRAVSFGNSMLWTRTGDMFGFRCHATVTCDPYAIFGAYTYAPVNPSGFWEIRNALNYALKVNYAPFTGEMGATTIARGSNQFVYLVTYERFSDAGASGGRVFGYVLDGVPRPRMFVPQHVVQFDPISTSDPVPVPRFDPDAVENVGCATLNLAVTLEAGYPLKARITDVNPYLKQSAQELANSMIEYSVEGFAEGPISISAKRFGDVLPIEDLTTAPALSKPTFQNDAALALPPSWALMTSPANPVILQGGQVQFVFDLYRTPNMQLLADNYFYVYLSSNDGDYVPGYSPYGNQPPVQDIIEYHVNYGYCPPDSGRMQFGNTGIEWWNNFSQYGDGDVHFDFSLNGSDDGLYEGSVFFMTSMNDAAWNVFGGDFGYLYPFYIDVSGTDCGGCDFGATLPVKYTTDGGLNYANTVGDLCSFADIDSLQGVLPWIHQTGPTIGILVKYREVGTYGADFDDFKLVVYDIYNRSGINPVTDLYYGIFTDWDVTNGNDLVNGNVTEGYIYNAKAGGAAPIYGHIGLPRSGSYWPDGSKTDPMYNGRGNSNPDEIYPPNNYHYDSLYSWIANRPEGGLTYHPNGTPASTASDRSYEAAFGKITLGPSGTKSFGFAIFGMLSGGTADITALSKFVDKYAGFHRGDIDNDEDIDLVDLVRLSEYVANPVNPGPVPFEHLGDVNNDLAVDVLDCEYLYTYFFKNGPKPRSAFKF